MGVALDAAGNVVAVGNAVGKPVDFGAGFVTTPRGGSDAFMVKLTGDAGGTLWAQLVGGPGNDYGAGVAVDHDGNVTVVGGFMGPVNFGGVTLAPTGEDAFVARYTAGLGLLGVRAIAGSGDARAQEVALGADGAPIAVGYAFPPIVFNGGVTLPSAGQGDAFVARSE